MSVSAINYISSIMIPDDTLSLKILLTRLKRAPPEANRFFQRCCYNVEELEVFLKENPHVFFVENKKFALYEEQLEHVQKKSVLYFKDKMMDNYSRPVHYMEFKNTHLGEAPDDISSFIIRFYPGKEFKKFLLSRPDVFIVYRDGTTFLIELETVQFFAKYLNLYGSMHISKFRGHIGHAPIHVQNYINKYYLGQEFMYFLENNYNKFRIDKQKMVHFAWK